MLLDCLKYQNETLSCPSEAGCIISQKGFCDVFCDLLEKKSSSLRKEQYSEEDQEDLIGDFKLEVIKRTEKFRSHTSGQYRAYLYEIFEGVKNEFWRKRPIRPGKEWLPPREYKEEKTRQKEILLKGPEQVKPPTKNPFLLIDLTETIADKDAAGDIEKRDLEIRDYQFRHKLSQLLENHHGKIRECAELFLFWVKGSHQGKTNKEIAHELNMKPNSFNVKLIECHGKMLKLFGGEKGKEDWIYD